MTIRIKKKPSSGGRSFGFGPVAAQTLGQIGNWQRGIKKLFPTFDYQFIRDKRHRVVKARIIGLPKGVLPDSEFHTYSDFYRAMRCLAIYYQVHISKPPTPPPLWLSPEGMKFWEDAAVRRIPDGNYVKRVGGGSLSGRLVHLDGRIREYNTEMQLIWVLAESGRVPNLEPFHYLPIDAVRHDRVREKAYKDWNGSMNDYIERMKLRPSVARDKLAMVNRDVHKAMIKAFFGGGGGIVNVKGMGAHAEKIIGWSGEKGYQINNWLGKWLAENQDAGNQ